MTASKNASQASAPAACSHTCVRLVASAAQASVLTEPYIAASSKKLVITIATPVRRDGQMVGVAGADMDLESIAQLLGSLKFQGHGQAFRVSAQGTVLLHPNRNYWRKAIQALCPQDAPRAEAGPPPRKRRGGAQSGRQGASRYFSVAGGASLFTGIQTLEMAQLTSCRPSIRP